MRLVIRDRAAFSYPPPGRCLLSGESPRDAKAIGALMNARGLMELIIINIGLQAGLIKPGLFTILVIMAILTTLMATPLFNRIMRDRPAPALPATDGPPA